MAVPKLQYTPVRVPGDKAVHAVTLRCTVKAACGKGGRFVVAPQRDWHITCRDCKKAVGYDVRKKRKSAK